MTSRTPPQSSPDLISNEDASYLPPLNIQPDQPQTNFIPAQDFNVSLSDSDFEFEDVQEI